MTGRLGSFFPMVRFRSFPLLLYSYLATEMLAPFFASFLILYSVFFLVRLVPLLDVVLDLGIGLGDFIRLVAYIFPHMLMYIIPMAGMMGTIICFTRLTNDREILAFKACGISLYRMLPPVIIIALAISVLAGLFSIRLIPAGEIAMKQLMFHLAKKKIDKGLEEKKFTEALGDLVVYVDHIDRETERWYGVHVSDMRGRELPIITIAQTGHMVSDMDNMRVVIVLNNGSLHSTDGTDSQVIRFRRYRLQIPLKPPTIINGTDVTSLNHGAMTMGQLLEAADHYGRDSRRGLVYLMEFHTRLTLPVGCFILSLLGVPFGLQASPGRRAIGVPMGLFVFVLYYLFYTTGKMLSEERVLPVGVGMWMVNIIFALATIYVFRRVVAEKSILPARVANLFYLLWERYIRPPARVVREKVSALITPGSKKAATAPVGPGAAAPIHADPDTHIFHLPGCRHYNNPACTRHFRDPELAHEDGFQPCVHCRRKLAKFHGSGL